MTKLDLVKKAIDFAMTDLCGSHLDMPCGCDGCPYGNVIENEKPIKFYFEKEGEDNKNETA